MTIVQISRALAQETTWYPDAFYADYDPALPKSAFRVSLPFPGWTDRGARECERKTREALSLLMKRTDIVWC